MEYAKNKVVLIGLDGATFDVIQPWIENGDLPNIYNIINSGVSGELESIYNPSSPLAWSSIITGKNPGKHGIFFFADKRQNDYSVKYINARARDGKAIWKIFRLAIHGT